MVDFPTITDRNVQYPNRFTITDVATGDDKVVEITPFDGSAENGTALDSALFAALGAYIPAALESATNVASDYITNTYTNSSGTTYIRYASGKLVATGITDTANPISSFSWGSPFSAFGRRNQPARSPNTGAGYSLANMGDSVWYSFKTAPVVILTLVSLASDTSADNSGGVSWNCWQYNPFSYLGQLNMVYTLTDKKNYTDDPVTPLAVAFLYIGEGVDI